MLTGKDVYEAARPNIVKHGFEDLEWEDFVPEAQEFYVELAARLNTSHIAPLQGVVETLQSNEQATFKDALYIIGATVTDSVTTISDLQSQITALKALVKDYQEFTKYQTPLLKAGCLEWEAKSNELYQRAQKLRGEEPTK